MAKTTFSIKYATSANDLKSSLTVTDSDRDTVVLTAAHYVVNLSNYILAERYTDNSDSSIIANDQGYMMPVMGKEFDSILINVIKRVNANFLDSSSYVSEEELRNAVYQILTNSRSAYATLLSVYRTQAGMNIADENKVALAPVLWHHEFKGITGMDNHIANGGFIEILKAKDFNTLAKRQASNDVCFTFSIGNKEWATLVSEMLDAIYLPIKWKKKLEYFFTNVFVVPGGNEDVLNTVVFWPTSQILKGVNKDDKNVEARLHNYETATFDFDNIATRNNLEDYRNALVDTTSALFAKYPQLNDIFDQIQCYNGSEMDFTRPLAYQKVNWVLDNNVEHFIKTTSIGYVYTSETGTDDPVPTRHLQWAYSPKPGVISPDNTYWFKPTQVSYNTESLQAKIEKLGYNLVYQSEAEIKPEDDALFKGWVAPLCAVALDKYQAGNSTSAEYRYYVMPLFYIGGYIYEYWYELENHGTGDSQYIDSASCTNGTFNMIATLAASGAISPAQRLVVPDFVNSIYDLDDYVDHGLLAYTLLLETTSASYYLPVSDCADLQMKAASSLCFNNAKRDKVKDPKANPDQQ